MNFHETDYQYFYCTMIVFNMCWYAIHMSDTAETVHTLQLHYLSPHLTGTDESVFDQFKFIYKQFLVHQNQLNI